MDHQRTQFSPGDLVKIDLLRRNVTVFRRSTWEYFVLEDYPCLILSGPHWMDCNEAGIAQQVKFVVLWQGQYLDLYGPSSNFDWVELCSRRKDA